MHDSVLRLRIFFKRERTHSIDTDLQGKVLDPVKKIGNGGKGRKQLPGFPPALKLFAAD